MTFRAFYQSTTSFNTSTSSMVSELMPDLRWMEKLWEALLTGVKPRKKEETSSIVAEIHKILMELREQDVHVQEDEVREYLFEFPEMLDVIPKAIAAARKQFPNAQLSLQVYQDPEMDDKYLALYVRLERYDDFIMEHIEVAEAEFIELLANKKGWLQLTTDFQVVEAGYGF